MKKYICLLLVVSLLAGLLSGCTKLPFSKENKIAEDIQTAKII